jgi:hypothetical protein
MFQRWHWFAYHFQCYRQGREHLFAKSVVDAYLDVEEKLPGFAAEFVTRLTSVGGREKDTADYQQLLQQLAELLVLRQAVTCDWGCEAGFEHEPTGPGSRRNPELVVTCGADRVGIEVKAPALLEHAAKRAANPVQLPSRTPSQEIARTMTGGGPATLPRDNPVKDFLISADAKFAPFHQQPGNFYGLLVIVWDDHIYEPISSLLGAATGLFTPNGFAKLPDGSPHTFPHVDAVVVVRHLHIFTDAAAERPYVGPAHPLDYGRDGQFPFKAYVRNPAGKGLPEAVLRCFQAYTPGPELGAKYLPSDLIWWAG